MAISVDSPEDSENLRRSQGYTFPIFSDAQEDVIRRWDRYGEPDVMSLSEEPVPEPQDREVLIRVGFAGVNPADSKARSGENARAGYRVRDFKFPFVTGMDAAGVVERTGRTPMDSGKEIA